MSAWTYSLVFIVTDANKEDSNRLATAMDHCPIGSDEYTVPLSATGDGPPTHWLCHSFCIEAFAQMLGGIGQGTLPEPEAGGTWEDYGLTVERVWGLMGSAIVSCIEGADPQTHVAEVISAAGLQRVA
jgi:hypothetical protein